MCVPDTVDAARIVGFPGSYVFQTALGVVPYSGEWDDVPWLVYLRGDGSDENSYVDSDEFSSEEEEGEVDNYEPQELVPKTESEAEIDWDATDDESSVVGPGT